MFKFLSALPPAIVAVGLISAAPALAAGAPPSLAPVIGSVAPGVVNISVEGTVAAKPNPMLSDPFFRQFFGDQGPQQPSKQKFQAVGSGVIIDADKGLIITNNHVVEHADRIRVTLQDRRDVKATLVGSDPQTDIAVLKIPSDHLTSVPFGDPNALQVGDYVVALGDPFGLGQTATFGIVSAKGRSGLGIEGYENFIQTDASINPGNSGGALIDVNGKLVGINTAIVSGGGGGSVGIGFAIPIDMAKHVADQLVAHGKIERGQLGILVQDLTPEIARAMGAKQNTGALVSQVQPGSAAGKAGVKAGDLVVALDGKPLQSSTELRNDIGLTAPGTTVKLTIVRKSGETVIPVTIEKAKLAREEQAKAPDESALEGVELSSVPPNVKVPGGNKGAYVAGVERGSRAQAQGLKAGDVIIGADQEAVTGVDDLIKILKQHDQQSVVLTIARGDDQLVLVLG